MCYVLLAEAKGFVLIFSEGKVWWGVGICWPRSCVSCGVMLTTHATKSPLAETIPAPSNELSTSKSFGSFAEVVNRS